MHIENASNSIVGPSNVISGNRGHGASIIRLNQGSTNANQVMGNLIGTDHQNFPELTSATSDDTQTTIEGTLNSTPNTTFRLEFFSNPSCDPSGFGQG